MSYLVLARKYRPQTFADVVGQSPIVKTLQNSLLRQRVAHAILFSGVRGVGKTTLARIMAKAINCEGDGEKPPCNTCRPCSEITAGSALDLLEIDGASNRGIQEIRELKEKLRFLPVSSRYKIIIIDEVHMLTTEAFNALLKTLEEPPAHVFFMFATTELHKIPITILSRCQRYELKRISSSELTDHFTAIAAAENVNIAPEALALIVREAQGSVRDGLSLLDQMFSFGDSTISKDDVIQVLGVTDRNVLMTITRSLLSHDRAGALNALDTAYDYGIDVKRFTAELLECFRTILLLKVGDCTELIDLPREEIQRFTEIADDFSFETIHMKLNLLLQAVEELNFSSQPRLTLETAFLKVIEAGNTVSLSSLIDKIDDLIGDEPVHQHQETDVKKKEQPDEQLTLPPEIPVQPAPPPDMYEHDLQPPPPEEPSPSEKPTAKEYQPPEEPTAAVEIHPHTRDVRRDWTEFTDYVKERKVWMSQDLQRSISAKEIDNELHLHYSDPANCALLRKKDNLELLTAFVLDFFQKDLTVRFILPEEDNDGANGDDPATPHKQRQQLASDPLVQMTVEIFGGQIGDIRIGPRSR